MLQAGDKDQTSGERPLHVGYLVSQYPAVNHTFILREIRGLRQAGLSVEVASIRDADRPAADMSPDEKEELGSTSYIRSRRASWAGVHFRVLLARPAAYLGTLLYAIQHARWDLVQVLRNLLFFAEAVVAGDWLLKTGARHLHSHFASTPALFASRLFGFTFSLTIHGPDEFNDVDRFLMREKVKRASLIVTISNFGRSQVLRASNAADWHKVQVVRLGVDPGHYRYVARKASPQRFELISVGRLAPAKAQRILIQACAELIHIGRPLRLRLVGAGPDRADLEQLARKLGIAAQVIFEGALSHDRVLTLYEQSDLFVLASFAEGVPVVLMEAMALGLPCIATRITGIPELIRDGIDGLLAAPSDVHEFAACIIKLMDNPELCQRLAEAAREKVVREYNNATNIGQLAGVFRMNLLQE